MNRRDFLQAGTAGLALSVAGGYHAAFAADKAPRVGLIGCGWYGKIDLLRLIQVAPVEVVSLCDVDKKMLANAAEQVTGRQKSKQKPSTYADYRDMLKAKHLDYETWTGPAPMRPYNDWVHPRGWRAFMEYGNGIMGDMCIHMLDMVRWMVGLGWPKQIASTGGILVDKASKSNISDTQLAT